VSSVTEMTASCPAATPEARRAMAIEWLLHSGISIADPVDPHCGALYSHYDGEQGRHELIYPEATGYGLSLLSDLHAHGATDRCLQRARVSAGWLMRWAERHGGIIAMGLDRGREVPEAYTFDHGVCCKGLLDLYRVTSDEDYLRCAETLARWIIERALRPDGSVRPVFDLEAGDFVEAPSPWYKVSGSFHAKISMALLDLAALRRDQRFREAAVRMLQWARGQQHPDGSFPVNAGTKATYLHFHWYTVEAFLYAFARERSEEYIMAAARAVDWALKRQAADGTFPRWVHRMALRETAADVQAQAVRSVSLLHMLRPAAALQDAARRACAALLAFQRVTGGAAVRGGFTGGSIRKYRVVTRRSLQMTSWAAMFAIQALRFMETEPGQDFNAYAARLF
jgi:uncharacterized protein YyaL (SSP411 family)